MQAAPLVAVGALVVGALVAVALLGGGSGDDVTEADDVPEADSVPPVSHWPVGKVFGRDKLTQVHPEILAFLFWWNAHGPFAIKVTSGKRIESEQRALYAQGRTTAGPIVTNAASSRDTPHGLRVTSGGPVACAIDVYPWTGSAIILDFNDPRWAVLIARGEEHGLFSGSRFSTLKDNPHLEVVGWRALPFFEQVA